MHLRRCRERTLERNLSFFGESFLDFSSHSGRVFAFTAFVRTSLSLSLSLFLSLSLTSTYPISLSLSIPRSAISSFRVYYAYPRFVSDPPRSTFTPRACPLLFPALFSRVAEPKLHPSPRKEPTSFPSHSIQQFGSA